MIYFGDDMYGVYLGYYEEMDLWYLLKDNG